MGEDIYIFSQLCTDDYIHLHCCCYHHHIPPLVELPHLHIQQSSHNVKTHTYLQSSSIPSQLHTSFCIHPCFCCSHHHIPHHLQLSHFHISQHIHSLIFVLVCWYIPNHSPLSRYQYIHLLQQSSHHHTPHSKTEKIHHYRQVNKQKGTHYTYSLAIFGKRSYIHHHHGCFGHHKLTLHPVLHCHRSSIEGDPALGTVGRWKACLVILGRCDPARLGMWRHIHHQVIHFHHHKLKLQQHSFPRLHSHNASYTLREAANHHMSIHLTSHSYEHPSSTSLSPLSHYQPVYWIPLPQTPQQVSGHSPVERKQQKNDGMMLGLTHQTLIIFMPHSLRRSPFICAVWKPVEALEITTSPFIEMVGMHEPSNIKYGELLEQETVNYSYTTTSSH